MEDEKTPLKFRGKTIGTSYIGKDGILYSEIDSDLLDEDEKKLFVGTPNLADYSISEINLDAQQEFIDKLLGKGE